MRLTAFTVPATLLWLVGWKLIPNTYLWINLVPLQWKFYDGMSFVVLSFFCVALTVPHNGLSRFERYSVAFGFFAGLVNAFRELFLDGAKGSFEIIIGIPFLLVFLLLLYYRLFRKEKAPKSFGGNYSENKGIGFNR